MSIREVKNGEDDLLGFDGPRGIYGNESRLPNSMPDDTTPEYSLNSNSGIDTFRSYSTSTLFSNHIRTSSLELEISPSVSVNQIQALNDYLQRGSSSFEFNLGGEKLSGTNRKKIHVELQKFIEKEFPVKVQDQVPTTRQLINVHLNKNHYQPGDWVEILGTDMKWNLDMVTRVIRKAPIDWDYSSNEEPKFTYSYNAGNLRNIKTRNIRAPKHGLMKLFGCRPWVWQQWALLKLEEKLRFQEYHQNDFETLDIQEFGADSWAYWLQHPSNKDFKLLYYDVRIGDSGREALKHHIQTPFQILNDMSKGRGDWNFHEDPNINVFTYPSLLGSGLFLGLSVAFIQICVPIIITIESPSEVCREVKRFDVEFTMVLILLYYMLTLLPGIYGKLYFISGARDSCFTRLLTLRHQIYVEGGDSLIQTLGYRMDIYMNSAFGCMIAILNIIVIRTSKSSLDVVLNALAFLFIDRIDEEIAQSMWYDPKKRWIRAGTVQAYIQKLINTRLLSSVQLFGVTYNMDEELLWGVCDGDDRFMKNKTVAKVDAENPDLMNAEEMTAFLFGNVSEEMNNYAAKKEYCKSAKHFGFFVSILGKRSPVKPIFERMNSFWTWSRWEKLLFVCPVPDLGNLFITDEYGMHTLNEALDHDNQAFTNFNPISDSSPARRTLWYYISVMCFLELPHAIRSCLETGKPTRIFPTIVDAIVTWCFYCFFIFFPVFHVTSIFEACYEMVSGKCVPISIISLLSVGQRNCC